MKVEGIHFKRCCCCLPLRYGLLILGYLKLIAALIFLEIIIEGIMHMIHSTRVNYSGWVSLIMFTFVDIPDIILTIVFIIGCHKRNVRLLRIYYFYSIVLCVISTLVWIGFVIFYFVAYALFMGLLVAAWIVQSIVAGGITITVLQVYSIFMTKSEIQKLENSSQFTFVNNAAEPECSMLPDTGNIRNISDEPPHTI